MACYLENGINRYEGRRSGIAQLVLANATGTATQTWVARSPALGAMRWQGDTMEKWPGSQAMGDHSFLTGSECSDTGSDHDIVA